MEHDEFKIGKVNAFSEAYGVGEIATLDKFYLFTKDDIRGEVSIGDVVKFRGRVVNEQPKAYMVTKIDQEYVYNNEAVKDRTLNPRK